MGSMDPSHGTTNVPEYCQVVRFSDSKGEVREVLFPKGLDLDRPKRTRTTFSNDQLAALEREFRRNPYVVGKERTAMAHSLGLSETQVKVWFQNRRTKQKREQSKEEENKKSSAESLATNNVLRLLENNLDCRLPSVDTYWPSVIPTPRAHHGLLAFNSHPEPSAIHYENYKRIPFLDGLFR